MISWSISDGNLLFLDKAIMVWSHVRNEINGKRPKKGMRDVVYTEKKDGSRGVPYMPRPFPLGSWNILGIVDHQTPNDQETGYLYPYFIRTDAWQMVDEWEIDQQGFYLRMTGRQVADYGYGLHWAEKSSTTLGCGRVDTKDHLLFIVEELRELFKHSKTIPLQVTA